MAQVIITIADAHAQRALDGIAGYFGYRPFILPLGPFNPAIPNPETKAQFARRMIAASMKDWVKIYESTLAADSARTTAQQAADVLDITG